MPSQNLKSLVIPEVYQRGNSIQGTSSITEEVYQDCRWLGHVFQMITNYLSLLALNWSETRDREMQTRRKIENVEGREKVEEEDEDNDEKQEEEEEEEIHQEEKEKEKEGEEEGGMRRRGEEV
ncbi:hypothetical protein PoB_001478800 [Plakobranchus ocellatus]|uniref:Uncharacterized protein n=1 Tax=Plakobranchus ocellatus TaxID=259542 RepID=A0AAV3Z190_9GAST|nr:hypothetical protein PoB_001478800 [Plakobranchus ocellatus]